MDLSLPTPLELKLRGPEYRGEEPFVGGCWFGTRDHSIIPVGACRKDPARGSVTGLCDEHRELLAAWSRGENHPDPRPRVLWSHPQYQDLFPDMYAGGLLIGDAP